jgi:transcription-repair coupling factor (superfamily II helicase)
MQDLDIRGAGNLLGAEQSGFMEELGYETYLKILKQAMAELANETRPADNEERLQGDNGERRGDRGDYSHGRGSSAKGNQTSQFSPLSSHLEYVDDCAIESDLEMYFPDLYVPSSSERMLLYRELDNIKSDSDLDKYRSHLVDRFGKIPHEGEELLQVVPLRRLGKELGCEKIMLKQGQMMMYFPQNPLSTYYQSAAFDSILNYVGRHARRCNLREIRGKRSMVIKDVKTVGDAVGVLREMKG